MPRLDDELGNETGGIWEGWSVDNLASWQDVDLRLRLEAAEKVIASWETGDLAAAVRELNAAVDQAKGGAA